MNGRGGSIVRNYFTLKRVVSYNNRRHYQPPENNFGNYFEGGGGGGSLGRVDISTCNEEKFDTAPPDLDKFVQIQQKLKYWFFTKPRFLSKKLGFFSWTYNFFGL